MANNYNIRKLAGDKQESEVAYQLDRLLKKQKCEIIHDLRLSDGKYNAQIDHLIIHRYGFVIVESKSIKGSVLVNSDREWARSIGNKWEGMPSPVKQVQMQYKMLNAVLERSAPQLIRKILGVQTHFGGRVNDIIIAISSNTIFNRKTAPEDISKLVLKTEFVADRVIELMNRCGGVFSTDPWFSEKERLSIYHHLSNLKEYCGNDTEITASKTAPELEKIDDSASLILAKPRSQCEATATIKHARIHCKSCLSNDNLRGAYGKYGYYVQCECGSSTSMKMDCISCNSAKSKVKVKKKGNQYSGNCTSCGNVFNIGNFEQQLS